MRTLVDTSAFYALLDRDDRFHQRAAAWLGDVGSRSDERLLTHNYVVIETEALVRKRLGPEVAGRFLDTYVPAVAVAFVDEDVHDRAVAAHLVDARRSGASLIDHVSFALIRNRQLDRAFTFDDDFRAAGIHVVP